MKNLDPGFWKGRRVFITGHTGFKGSWLCLWLQLLGARVKGYALNPCSQPSLFELGRIASVMDSEFGDVGDLDHLQRALSDFQPEIVIHMAAQSLVRKSHQVPLITYKTNVIGTLHLLEALRQVPSVRAAVMITSDKCYDNREWVWGYRETSELGGDDPYSSSKACAELVVKAYRHSFFESRSGAGAAPVQIASARAGNVIGGGDWSEDRLVPDILQALLRNEPAVIRNPLATRPWQLVLEPLHGYLMLAERLYADGGAFAEAWNFGPPEQSEKNVGWMADRLYSLWGAPFRWATTSAQGPRENTYLKLDSSKARARLDWSPKLDLNTTLDWIVRWTKAYQNSEDMAVVTRRQIEEFMAIQLKD